MDKIPPTSRLVPVVKRKGSFQATDKDANSMSASSLGYGEEGGSIHEDDTFIARQIEEYLGSD